MKKSNNLSDVASIASVRSNLSVYSKVESDGRYLNEASNLSDLGNVATARSNLSVQSVAESDGKYLAKSSNLNDVQDKATARNNLSVYSKAQSDANYPNVSEFSSVKSTNGWQELPGGLIMQWGVFQVGRKNVGRYSGTIPYNTPFSTKSLNVVPQIKFSNYMGNVTNVYLKDNSSLDSFEFQLDNGADLDYDVAITWFAIGY